MSSPHGTRVRRLQAAFGRLSSVLTEVAATADASVGRRCPHRGVRSRCHYRSSCRNQVDVAEERICGGDARVRFDPVDDTSPRARGSQVG